jgi:transcriptional regulator with XRE-family HTH domain
MKRTNFDRYLEEQMKAPGFAERFENAGAAWDIALQLAALRRAAGLSQKELARRLKTSQQQISRLESPAYEGHSLSMLRRVARELNADVRVILEPRGAHRRAAVAEDHHGMAAGRGDARRAKGPRRTSDNGALRRLQSPF